MRSLPALLHFLILGSSSCLAARSSTSTSTSTKGTSKLSPSAAKWYFDNRYNPKALFKRSSILNRSRDGKFALQSQDVWDQRDISQWLIEYCVRNDLSASTRFLDDLLESPAFKTAPLDCSDSTSPCVLRTKDLKRGLTDDQFNAMLVKVSIANFRSWFEDVKTILNQASVRYQQLGALFYYIVVPTVKKPSDYISDDQYKAWANAVQNAVDIALLYPPVKSIVQDIQDQSIYQNLVGRLARFKESDSMAFQSVSNLVRATGLNVDGTESENKSVKNLATYKFTKDAIQASYQELSDIYFNKMEFILDRQQRLADLLNKINNNGFARGGLISQILTGNWVIDTSSTSTDSAADDVVSGLFSLDISRAIQIGGIQYFKRKENYKSLEDCQDPKDRVSFFGAGSSPYGDTQENLFICVRNAAGTWNAVVPYSSSPDWRFDCQLVAYDSRGISVLRNLTDDRYDYSATDFLSNALSCSRKSKTFTAQAQRTSWGGQVYPEPDFSVLRPGRINVNDVPCLYNAPICDAGSQSVQKSCDDWKFKIWSQQSDYCGCSRPAASGSSGGSPTTANAFSSSTGSISPGPGKCSEPEVMAYCALELYVQTPPPYTLYDGTCDRLCAKGQFQLDTWLACTDDIFQ